MLLSHIQYAIDWLLHSISRDADLEVINDELFCWDDGTLVSPISLTNEIDGQLGDMNIPVDHSEPPGDNVDCLQTLCDYRDWSFVRGWETDAWSETYEGKMNTRLKDEPQEIEQIQQARDFDDVNEFTEDKGTIRLHLNLPET